jgi:carbamoyltransferase
MKILGLHGGVTINQHDPAAALIVDGKLIAVCEEERFVRVKTCYGWLPIYAIKACLREAGLKMQDIDLVVHAGETYEDMPPRIKLYLEHYFGHAPRIQMINHQLAHLASAYFCSGFEQSMCLSYDAYGDRLSTALAVGDRVNGIKVLETRPAEQSLGSFYSLITSYLGFLPDEDEYKVMGLAPYGKIGVQLHEIARPSDDGFYINPGFWDRDPPSKTRFEPWYGKRLVNLLGPARQAGEQLSQRYKDVAFATQKSLEECAISLVSYLHKLTKSDRLCLAGGVALNCSTNGVLQRLPWLKDLFVQPAASDRGLALGCAVQAAFENGERLEKLEHVFYGPTVSSEDVYNALKVSGVAFKELENPSAAGAKLIAEGKIIGWFQGRSEFGPRALGHRSILADPRHSRMKDLVNAKIKFREEFRPFAPAVMEERANELFEMKGPSPFMTLAVPVREAWRDKLQAITHVNNTARVQTVNKTVDPIFHNLIHEMEKLSGVPVVLNTSFNVRGQPIVESPLDALGTFAASGLDAVIMDRFVVAKNGSIF